MSIARSMYGIDLVTYTKELRDKLNRNKHNFSSSLSNPHGLHPTRRLPTFLTLEVNNLLSAIDFTQAYFKELEYTRDPKVKAALQEHENTFRNIYENLVSYQQHLLLDANEKLKVYLPTDAYINESRIQYDLATQVLENDESSVEYHNFHYVLPSHNCHTQAIEKNSENNKIYMKECEDEIERLKKLDNKDIDHVVKLNKWTVTLEKCVQFQAEIDNLRTNYLHHGIWNPRISNNKEQLKDQLNKNIISAQKDRMLADIIEHHLYQKNDAMPSDPIEKVKFFVGRELLRQLKDCLWFSEKALFWNWYMRTNLSGLDKNSEFSVLQRCKEYYSDPKYNQYLGNEFLADELKDLLLSDKTINAATVSEMQKQHFEVGFEKLNQILHHYKDLLEKREDTSFIDEQIWLLLFSFPHCEWIADLKETFNQRLINPVSQLDHIFDLAAKQNNLNIYNEFYEHNPELSELIISASKLISPDPMEAPELEQVRRLAR